MAMRWYVCIVALTALMATGCSITGACRPAEDCGPGSRPPPPERVLSLGCTEGGPLRLDRGDWAVSRQSAVWKVLETQEGSPPRHIGYLTRRRFRQMRGGPAYDIFAVTTLNRSEEIGRIDQMGHAYRYRARRNAGFEEVDLGTNSMENGVAAIFDSNREVLLEKTTQRRIAFEMLDRDGSGFLEAEEMAPHGDRVRAADTDRDGRLGFEEFNAIPKL